MELSSQTTGENIVVETCPGYCQTGIDDGRLSYHPTPRASLQNMLLHGAIVMIPDIDLTLIRVPGSGCRGQLGWADLCELAVQ
jgi:hypothetical protein